MSTTCSPRRVATRMYVLAVLPSLFALSLRGDTIELKTGEKIDGRFKQATSAGVVMEVGGQSITVPIARVRAIYLGEAPAAKADSTWTDALDALKALQSVTSSGVSYRDYAPRVLDAKVKVDKYLSSSAPGKQAPAISLAMRFYELASAAWGANIVKDYSRSTDIGRILRSDLALAECPLVKAAIADSDASAAGISGGNIGSVRLPPKTPAETARTAVMFTGTRVGEQPNILWFCAALKIAEAEK